MSLTVENLEKNMAKLTIEVPAEKLEEAIKAAYNKQKNKISVPGFRKGKVPQKYLEKMYGVEMFYEDAANMLIPDAYAEEVEASDLEIVSQPKIEVTQIEKGKAFIFTAEVIRLMLKFHRKRLMLRLRKIRSRMQELLQ